MPTTLERPAERRRINPYTCGGCSNTWTGLAQCHCSGCHETFGGEALFRRHIDRRGRHLEPHLLTDRGHAVVQVGGVWRSSRPNSFRAIG